MFYCVTADDNVRRVAQERFCFNIEKTPIYMAPGRATAVFSTPIDRIGRPDDESIRRGRENTPQYGQSGRPQSIAPRART